MSLGHVSLEIKSKPFEVVWISFSTVNCNRGARDEYFSTSRFALSVQDFTHQVPILGDLGKDRDLEI